ncbi:MAG: hypothetical protein IIW00_02270 [Alistipes sp.]|nr:hypothetical protein [Alistipes sp.]
MQGEKELKFRKLKASEIDVRVAQCSYVGKITNFFKKISVAEILVESASLNEGDSLLFMGETTGVKECVAENIVLHEQVVKQVSKGTYCSMKVDSVLRRGDKLYKMVPADHEDVPKY